MNRAISSTIIGLVLAGGVQLFQAPRPNTITVAGPSANQPTGVAWGVTLCPARGATASSLAFIVQGNTLNGSGSTATVIVENHTAGTTMCSLEVDCTATVTSTAATTCNTGVTCAGGDAIHIEWDDTACALGAFPQGAGAGTLQEL